MRNSCAMLQLGLFEESFGLSIVESILFGRPALTRSQPAAREIVGTSELLIELTDPLDWYTILVDYFARRVRPESIDSDRRFLIRQLSLKRMTTKYSHILTEIIESK